MNKQTKGTKMLNNESFFKTAITLGPKTTEEFELMKETWERCEAAMQGKSVQKPKLFKHGLTTFGKTPLNPKNTVLELERKDLQFLKSSLQEYLSETELEKFQLKAAIDYFWNQAEPGTAKGAAAFEELKFLRTLQKKLKTKYNKTAKIQSLIKKTMNN